MWPLKGDARSLAPGKNEKNARSGSFAFANTIGKRKDAIVRSQRPPETLIPTSRTLNPER